MADWNFILAPATVDVQFKFDEVSILLNSLRLMRSTQKLSGFAEWVTETAEKLDDDTRLMTDIIAHALYFMLEQDDWHTDTFPDFIAKVQAADPDALSKYLYEGIEQASNFDTALSNYKEYMQAVREVHQHKIEEGYEFTGEVWHQRYHYLTHTQAYQDDLVAYLQHMWDTYLQPEWKRVRAMTYEAYQAYTQQNYGSMEPYKAIETITGRNLRGSEMLEEKLKKTDRLIFIPSPHIGPYIGWGSIVDGRIELFFGVRQPENAEVKSTALTRNELLVRLNALSDETRLKILELLTQNEEMCAQDFINELDLSQSSASRHLRQLTASGYVSERRRDVAKCYTLNMDRIDDTIMALKDFLKRND